MVTVKEIYDFLAAYAPPERKMDFDNVGLLAGWESRPVTRVLVALDITTQVIDEAARIGAELIVSHHPMFFELKRVTDTDKNPLSNVTVSVYAAATASSVSAKGSISDLKNALTARRKAAGSPIATTTTDATGYYSFPLSEGGSYLVRAEKTGYVAQEKNVEASRIVTQDFILLREGETLPSELITFPEDTEFDNYGDPDYDEWDMLVSNIYPVSFIGAYAGKQIKTVSFKAGGTSIENCTLVVDFDDTRALALAPEDTRLQGNRRLMAGEN